MSTFTFDLDTTASPEVAFDYLVDLTSTRDFIDQVEDVRLVSGDPGAKGSVYEVTVGRLLSDQQLTYQLDTVERPRHIEASMHTGSISAVESWTITPSGGGSHLVYAADYDLKGLAKIGSPFASLVMRLQAGGIEKHLRERLDALSGSSNA